MSPGELVPYISLILSMLTAAAYIYWSHRSDARTYTSHLEERVAKLETALAAANKRITELEEENIRLMRRLLANGGTK